MHSIFFRSSTISSCVRAHLQARFLPLLFHKHSNIRFYSCATEKMNAFSRFLVSYLMGFVQSCQQLYIKMHSRLFCIPSAHAAHHTDTPFSSSSLQSSGMIIVVFNPIFIQTKPSTEKQTKNNVHVYQNGKTCLTDENRYRCRPHIRMNVHSCESSSFLSIKFILVSKLCIFLKVNETKCIYSTNFAPIEHKRCFIFTSVNHFQLIKLKTFAIIHLKYTALLACTFFFVFCSALLFSNSFLHIIFLRCVHFAESQRIFERELRKKDSE